MRRIIKHLILWSCALVCGSVVARAEPALRLSDQPPAETRVWPYAADLPRCEDPVVLARVQREFQARESDYWDSPLTIDQVTGVRETGFRTRGASFIPRRSCEGRVALSDGARRLVVYEIAEGLGPWGFGYGLAWCVNGLDRNHAYPPNCRGLGR